MKRLFLAILACLVLGAASRGVRERPGENDYTILLTGVHTGYAQPHPLYGIERLTALDILPVLDTHAKAAYVGSIDKKGGNADWDWWLYQDERDEWVIFDVEGPGCIYNFVQHRYPSSEEPVFRFYFDGEQEPRMTIRGSEFCDKHPFIEPLASSYIAPMTMAAGPSGW